VKRLGQVSISRGSLRSVRPDLSVPEVRSTREWTLFRELTLGGHAFGSADGPWRPSILRELDMTRDRELFRTHRSANCLPLIEGRMLHQFRHDAKRYVAGRGRSAVWAPTALREACVFRPQFWVRSRDIPTAARARVGVSRVGFCDVTGQTNERTMLAARVPAGVVCGNKVPTILFQGHEDQRRVSDCWLAIANSFLFDWILRRVVTTTVNYFLLLELPTPALDLGSPTAARLASLSAALSACGHDHGDRQVHAWAVAEMRAEIDALVLRAYGQDLDTLELILEDFPLLDRAQAPIRGEPRSTVTKDFLLLRTAERLAEVGAKVGRWRERLGLAQEAGAVPYIPSQFDTPEDR
jgi:hypothetical protein